MLLLLLLLLYYYYYYYYSSFVITVISKWLDIIFKLPAFEKFQDVL